MDVVRLRQNLLRPLKRVPYFGPRLWNWHLSRRVRRGDYVKGKLTHVRICIVDGSLEEHGLTEEQRKRYL